MFVIKTKHYDLSQIIDTTQEFNIISIKENVNIDLETEKTLLIKFLNKKFKVEINNIIDYTDFYFKEINNKILINENFYNIEHRFNTNSSTILIISDNKLILLDKNKKK